MSRLGHLDPTDLDAVRRAVGLDQPGSSLHPVGLGRIVIGPEALHDLAGIVRTVRGPGPIAVVVDQRRMTRAGADLKALVGDLLRAVDAEPCVIRLGAAGSELHADDIAIALAVDGARGAGCIVAVGSGTICDIAKEAGRELGIPMVIVQTANSVNAFSDDMAVLLKNGVKRTVPSRWPDALVVDLTVLADAPAALNRAGVGELAALFTAPADWRLASAVGMDGTWDRRVVDLFRDGAPALLAAAPSATSRDMTQLRTLAELMTLSGLALGIAGRTSPISGTEHTVSHLLDMAAARADRPTGLHGAQVGVAALAVAVAWERLLSDFDPRRLIEATPRSGAVMHQRIVDAFIELDPSGGMAEECWSQYRQKLSRWDALRPTLPALVDGWPAIRDELIGLLGRPADVARALRSAGAAATFEELDPPATRALATWALFNGHLIRERFTLADLAWFGDMWSTELVSAAIDEAATIAAAVGAPDASTATAR